MKRYNSILKEKSEGSFLNGTQTGKKVVGIITKLLKDNKFEIQSRLGNSGWVVSWNGYEVDISFNPIMQKDKKGFFTDKPVKGQEDIFKKAFKLIKDKYPNAHLYDDSFHGTSDYRIQIDSEDE